MVHDIINHAVSEKVTARKKKEIKTAKWGRYNHVYCMYMYQSSETL